jgi:hypothetical protein
MLVKPEMRKARVCKTRNTKTMPLLIADSKLIYF